MRFYYDRCNWQYTLKMSEKLQFWKCMNFDIWKESNKKTTKEWKDARRLCGWERIVFCCWRRTCILSLFLLIFFLSVISISIWLLCVCNTLRLTVSMSETENWFWQNVYVFPPKYAQIVEAENFHFMKMRAAFW